MFEKNVDLFITNWLTFSYKSIEAPILTNQRNFWMLKIKLKNWWSFNSKTSIFNWDKFIIFILHLIVWTISIFILNIISLMQTSNNYGNYFSIKNPQVFS